MAKNPLEFQEDILNLIGKHYPGATKGNLEQNNQCAGELAMCMGAILAFAFRLNGPVIGRTVLQTMVLKIIENATNIDQTAGDSIRDSLGKIMAPGPQATQ